MTKMEYDEIDREMRNALQKGIQDYKKDAEMRTEDARRERALNYHRYKSDLRKLEAFSEKNIRRP